MKYNEERHAAFLLAEKEAVALTEQNLNNPHTFAIFIKELAVQGFAIRKIGCAELAFKNIKKGY